MNRPATLAAVFAAATKKIDDIPTVLLPADTTLFRSFNPESPHTRLPKPTAGNHVSKLQANKLLFPGDGVLELKNRFSGPSYNSGIPAAAGLYCVLQQQAMVNEAMHYIRKVGVWALTGRCVIKIRLMGSMLVADLSPHNPRSADFFGSWERTFGSRWSIPRIARWRAG